MRAAPPVSVRCTGGAVWHGVQTLLPALAAAVGIAWLLLLVSQQREAVLGHGVVVVAVACAAAAAGAIAWRVSRQPAALLVWDGQQWTVNAVPALPAVMVDLGGWLLLRWRSTVLSRQRWIAVSCVDAGPAWHGLRAALFALAPTSESAPRV